MDVKVVQLPWRIEVGGNDIEIKYPLKCNNNSLGQCNVAGGFIQIAQTFNNSEGDMEQSESSKTNTFYHELTHAILDVMNRSDLSGDENFVSTFSSLLCGTMRQIVEFQFPIIDK